MRLLEKVMFKGLCTLSMITCFSVNAVAGLDANEKRLIKIINQNEAQEIAFIEKTVNINSGTFNLNGVKKVGKFYRKSLEKLGFGKLQAINPRKKGGADIAYVDSIIPALDGLGGVGQFDHSTQEYMDIEKTIDATKRLALFLYQLR